MLTADDHARMRALELAVEFHTENGHGSDTAAVKRTVATAKEFYGFLSDQESGSGEQEDA